MTTKAEILAEVVAKSWKGFYILEAGNQVTGADGKTIREYTVNYAEQVNGKMTKRNLGFYVYQEGEADEDAQWRDIPRQRDTARDAVIAFLEGLPLIRYEIESIDEEKVMGFAKAWKEIDSTTANEVRLFIWKDEGQPIKARELV